MSETVAISLWLSFYGLVTATVLVFLYRRAGRGTRVLEK